MPARQVRPRPFDVSQILASSNVGLWVRDPERDVVYCDALTSKLFGLRKTEGAGGVSLERLFSAVHPQDRMIHHREVRRAKARYGLIAFEYRVMSSTDDVRSVLVCGHYDPPKRGQALNAGRGIVVDITGSRGGGRADEPAPLPVPVPDRHDGTPLGRAAHHALAAARAIARIEPQHDELQAAARLLLFVVARELAKQVPRPPVER